MTRFYKTDPNRTFDKIKLTPPVDSYTIVLLVLTLSTTQTTRGWFNRRLFWVVWSAQMAVSALVKDLAWQENQWFTGGQPYNVGQTFSLLICYISTTREPAQPCILVSGLKSCSEVYLLPSPPLLTLPTAPPPSPPPPTLPATPHPLRHPSPSTPL